MTSENRPALEARPLGRLWRYALALSLASGLAGCASPTPEPPPTQVAVVPKARETALRELGFRPTEQGWELDLAGRVMFPVDDASLSPEAQESIDRLAGTLRGLGITGLVVEGHTDNQGTAAYNQRLSERRAQVVALAFVARGFEPAQVRHQGFGFSRPIEDNRSEAGRQQNRRVTIIVSSL